MGRRKPANSVAVPKPLAKAAKRVGSQPEQQARWLLAFAWCDLGDRRNARLLPWELRAFLWVGSTYEKWGRMHAEMHAETWGLMHAEDLGAPRLRPPTCTADEVHSCQALLREGLRSLVYENIWPVEVPATRQVFQWFGPPQISRREDPSMYGTLTWEPIPPYRLIKVNPDSIARRIVGDPEGEFRMRVYETLRAVLARFRVCEREGCWKPFIARKRQAYCSRRCSQTVRTRKFRRRNPDRVKALRRQYYERSVRARAGQGVKIATRQLRGRVASLPSAHISDAAWRPLSMTKPTHWWQEPHERKTRRDDQFRRKSPRQV